MKKTILRWTWYVFLICIVVALLNLPTTISYITCYSDYRALNKGEVSRYGKYLSTFVLDPDKDFEYDEGASISAELTPSETAELQEILSRIQHSWLLPPKRFPTEENNRWIGISQYVRLYPTHYEIERLCATCPGYREIFADLEQLAEEIRDRYAGVPSTP